MFYADQVLSLLTPPPSPTLIHIKMLSATWKTSYLSYVQFSFVRYRVYIIPVYRVIIQKSSCDTSCTCTPLCISCITSDQQCVSSFLQTVFDPANIRGILPKKIHRQSLFRSINRIIQCMILDKILRLIVDFKQI